MNIPVERIREIVQCEEVEVREHVQMLWSGYGEIVKVTLIGGSQGEDSAVDAVVKFVSPPSEFEHKYGWDADKSHQRKLSSYHNELRWYQGAAKFCSRVSRVPRLLAGEYVEPGWLLVLEDLDAAGFPDRLNRVNDQQLEACLQWLANFHATFLTDRSQAASDSAADHGLWPIGTYWHLATRPDELAAMEIGRLKTAAGEIDAILSAANYQTLVHGDAKLANFCLSTDGVAAVDFQYVGGGCGIKDVAYFASSCFGDEECQRRESSLLDCYFKHLRQAIWQRAGRSIDVDAVEKEWRQLYPMAWTDFYRFLAGWSPGHWKMHGYSERLAAEVMDKL